MADSSTTISQTPAAQVSYVSARHPGFKYIITRALIYLILISGALFIFIPLAWTLSTSLKTEAQTLAYPPTWIPNPIQWRNYPDALTARPFDRYYMNTFIITILSVIGQVLSSSLVAYGFARFRFPGRNLLFMVVLSTLMIPFHLLIIPRFILFRYLGWLDTLLPLIVPNFFGGAFSIFLMRQYFQTIPLELDEAAKIDGANPWQTFWQILLPLAKPALGAVAVFEFMEAWQDFLGPLIYLSSDRNYTVSVGLAAFRNDYFTAWPLYMAAAAVAMVVPLIVFFLAQRYFISGVALTGSGGSKG
ncbi:sugar ABC transporter ATP-binding protein [Litorilinea aerophila]|nr:sugar ABC transporter ATP-binding protein [Litorilinea aerophila]